MLQRRSISHHRPLTMIGLRSAETLMVIAAGEQNAAIGTGATCVRSLAITGQIARGRETTQSQNELVGSDSAIGHCTIGVDSLV